MQLQFHLPWVVLVEILYHLPQVAAQTSDAVCLPSFNWAFNTLDQSPCVVGAYLQSVCIPNFNVPALPMGNHYMGPALNTANSCSCSTVTYSLLSACGACQNRTFQSWGDWSANCADGVQSITSYPNPIPALTAVPNWAFLNVEETNNTFDPARAEGLVRNGQPESTGSPIPKSTATTTTATDPQSTLTAPPEPNQSAPSRSPNVNAGAVAGGVVGGLAFIAILAVLSFWFCTKRLKKSPNQSPKPPMFSPDMVAPAPATNSPIATPTRSTPHITGDASLLHKPLRASNASLDTFSPPPPSQSDSSNYMSRISPASPSIYTSYDPYSRASMDYSRPNGQGYFGAPEV